MKNSKSFLVYGLSIGFALTIYALSYVGIKLKCESFIKDKVIGAQNLNSVQNEELNLIAQNQYLNSEERIVFIAQSELGMKKGDSPIITFPVSKEKIEQIQIEINSKYE
jgi:hypothetical protein